MLLARSATALHEGAVRLFESGNLAAAGETIEEAVRSAPDRADILNDAAAIRLALGRPATALVALRDAVTQAPENAGYRINLGVLQRRIGDLDGALATLRAVAAEMPRSADAHRQVGMTLIRLGRPEQALDAFGLALAQCPGWREAAIGYASALLQLDRAGEAVAIYLTMLRPPNDAGPGSAALHNNLGNAYLNVPDPRAALSCFARALACVDPTATADAAGIRYNRALTLLAMGDWRRGWQEHAARRDLAEPPSPRRSFEATVPRWDGAPLAGQTLLLHAEQGLGDTIQFIRFAGTARRRGLTDGGRVILEAQRPLLRLLAGMEGIDAIIAPGDELGGVDAHLPLLDLPMVLAIDDEGIDGAPYLTAPRPPKSSRRRIGLVWAGNPGHANDRRRSLPAAHLHRLVEGVDADFISLQVGARSDDVAAAGLGDRIAVLPAPPDMLETATRLLSLDGLITVDTAVAHLAGALGIPVRLLLPFIPDWRWQYGGCTTVWYRSVVLHRQKQPGDWAGVCEQVRGTMLEEA